MPAFNKNSDEYHFFENIFNVSCVVKLPRDTVQAIGVVQLLNEKHPLNELSTEYVDFELGNFMLRSITTTHSFLALTPEPAAAAKVLMHNTQRLTQSLAIVFKALYGKEGDKRFWAALKRNIFITTQLSFDKKTAKKHERDYLLVGSYNIQLTLFAFRRQLNTILSNAEQTLLYCQLPPTEIQKRLAELQQFHEELIKQYEADTQSSSTRITYAINSVVGVLGTGIGSLLGFYPGLIFGGISLYLASVVTKEYFGARELSTAMKAKYARTLPIHEQTGGKLARQEDQKNLSAMEPYRRALYYHHLTINNRQWETIELEPKVNNLFELNLKLISNARGKPITQSDIDNALDMYQSTEEEVNTVREVEKPVKEQIAQGKSERVTTTYAKLTYLIPKKLKNKGILSVKDKSKAFFDFGDFREEILQGLKSEHPNESADYFIATEEEFGGFKYLKNLKRYELKLFNGKRIEFEKSGAVTISDSEGQDHNVPKWVPVISFNK